MDKRSPKIEKLKKILKEMKSVVIAYSGGVDSTFLLKVSKDTLGRNNVLAVTAKSEVFPERELKEAKRIAKRLNIKLLVIRSREVDNKNFKKNPINRCYYCKKELFSKLKKIAKEKNMAFVIDGTNFDDLRDLRFGRKAARELGVKSPLAEVKLSKQDIRGISRNMRLPTWDKGTFACLASRFPHRQEINKADLKKVEKLEDFLRNLGFRQLRVRLHKDLARIEVGPDEVERFFNKALRKRIEKHFRDSNLAYTTLDLTGYRTGSMNPQ